jgi:hypothetical protein
VYSTRSSRHEHIDGAYFGTTFPHLFFLTFPELKSTKTKVAYVPRVFGFRLNKECYRKSLEAKKKGSKPAKPAQAGAALPPGSAAAASSAVNAPGAAAASAGGVAASASATGGRDRGTLSPDWEGDGAGGEAAAAASSVRRKERPKRTSGQQKNNDDD